jgi:hypothetical protein
MKRIQVLIITKNEMVNSKERVGERNKGTKRTQKDCLKFKGMKESKALEGCLQNLIMELHSSRG